MCAFEGNKLFGSLTSAERQRLQESSELRVYASDEEIFKEGEAGDGIYLIEQGRVEISVVVGQMERRPLCRLGAGDFFGEMAVLDHEPRSATVTAEESTTVYFVPQGVLRGLLEKSPQLALNFVQEFSMRMRDFNRQYVREVIQAERLGLVGRFARSIVHDFKNPLNIIGIAADMAGMENASLEVRRTAAGRIRKQLDRLSNMTNELLEFTRTSQKSIVLSRSNFANFMRRLIDEMSPELREKSVLLHCVNEPPAIQLLMDPHRMTHLFCNLFHNAVDAMSGGGKILLRFQQTETEVIIEVEDSGHGIPQEIRPRLFEAFVTSGKTQGTGLGLSICKKIIEDHGGWIEARNPPTPGAIFAVGIPIKP
jgi:signal transduction histidine kinase